jgi:hypothetical protein
MRYIYLVVEGQHDAAALGKLLKIFGFKNIRKKDEVDKYWARLIPEKYPHNNDLLTRMPVPFFYKFEDVSIVIHPSDGDSELIKTLNSTLANIDNPELISSVALFRDSDNKSASDSFSKLIEQVNQHLDPSIIRDQIVMLKNAGEISKTEPKVGVYVFPDNINEGYLEDILLQGAEGAYKDLLALANNYLNQIKGEYKIKWKPSSEKKVLVGCIANVLRPGASNQVSVTFDEWFSPTSIEDRELINNLNNFLLELIHKS